jgi:hypothetical protein
LDVGCSEGFYVEAASLLGFDSYCVDVASPNNDHCRDIGLNVYSLDMELPIIKLDFIFFRHTIEHLPDFLDMF